MQAFPESFAELPWMARPPGMASTRPSPPPSFAWGRPCVSAQRLPQFPPVFLSHSRSLEATSFHHIPSHPGICFPEVQDSHTVKEPSHPLTGTGNPQNNSRNILSHDRLTHFKKAFIEFNFQKERYLRQLCKDPESLHGCFWLL